MMTAAGKSEEDIAEAVAGLRGEAYQRTSACPHRVTAPPLPASAAQPQRALPLPLDPHTHALIPYSHFPLPFYKGGAVYYRGVQVELSAGEKLAEQRRSRARAAARAAALAAPLGSST